MTQNDRELAQLRDLLRKVRVASDAIQSAIDDYDAARQTQRLIDSMIMERK